MTYVAGGLDGDIIALCNGVRGLKFGYVFPAMRAGSDRTL